MKEKKKGEVDLELSKLSEVGVITPTIVINCACFIVWLYGLSLQLSAPSGGSWLGFWVQMISGYYAFSGVHDAAHHSASSLPWLNWSCGFFSTLIMLFPGSWDFWRSFHKEHHVHTNDPKLDPDWCCSSGETRDGQQNGLPGVVRGFMLAHWWYPSDYALRVGAGEKRPLREMIIFAVHVVSLLALTAWSIRAGEFSKVFWCYYAPGSLAVSLLVFLFGVVPHRDRHVVPQVDRWKTTYNVRPPVFAENALVKLVYAVLMQNQNYHGTHHAAPQIPYWRYHRAHEVITERLGNDVIPTYSFPQKIDVFL